MIYLYTGEGGGKTSNALGLAMRCIGHKKKVLIIQFMKWWDKTGEMLIEKEFYPLYQIYQFGREGWHGFDNLTDQDKYDASMALAFAVEKAKYEKPHLLVLDEINLAAHCKLVKIKDVLNVLDELDAEMNIVLTGRYAPQELIDRADFVNEIVDVKHPSKLESVEGIQY